MPIGYCKLCGRLVPIRPGAVIKEGWTAKYWYPVAHTALGDDTGGKQCGGTAKEI